jgi:hypothetical protein
MSKIFRIFSSEFDKNVSVLENDIFQDDDYQFLDNMSEQDQEHVMPLQDSSIFFDQVEFKESQFFRDFDPIDERRSTRALSIFSGSSFKPPQNKDAFNMYNGLYP